jgi:hypothetical protein
MEAVPSIKETGEVRALRFARARYQHQQASLTYRVNGGPSMWRPSTQLPRPKDAHHWNAADAQEYDDLLAGKPVRDALAAAERAVTAAVTPKK